MSRELRQRTLCGLRSSSRTTLTQLLILAALTVTWVLPGQDRPNADVAQARPQLVTATPSGLVGYWNFDEAGGNTAVDSSGNGNNGVLVGGPTRLAGKVGAGALSLNGSTAYVVIGSPVNLDDLAAFTYAAWIKPRVVTQSQYQIITKNNNWQDTHSLFLGSGVGTANQLRGAVVASSANAYSATPQFAITAAVWQHVAMTYDYNGDKKTHLYINGVETPYSYQTLASGVLTSDASANMYIGVRGNTNFSAWFDGEIDEVRVYNRALSAGEIAGVYSDTGSGAGSDTISPSVPVNVSAVAASSSAINVSWTASTDNVAVAGYRVYRGGTQIGAPTTTAFTDVGLTASTSYSYTVAAYDAAGNVSPPSASASATTLPVRVPADYYVSSTGNDLNSGASAVAAWRTITKANSMTFIPGDRILFEGGQVFPGALYFDAADLGTAANPIVVTSYGSGRATINGGVGVAFNAYNTAGFSIQNVNFVGSGAASNTDHGILFFTDLAGNVKLDTVTIDSVDVSGFGKSGIDIGSWNGSTGYKNVRITNANVHNNGENGIYIFGFTPRPSGAYANQNVYVGHSNAYNNSGKAGLSNPSGSGMVLSNTDTGTIEYCVAYNNGANNTNSAGPIGIWSFESRKLAIQHNESYGNHTQGGDGGGFDLDGGSTDSVMQYNYSHDNDGAGFLLAQYSGANSFTGDTVRYNISQNDGRKNGDAGIQFWNGGSGLTNAQVYNNTVFVSPSAAGQPKALWAMTPTTNVGIRNNIFVTTGGLSLATIASGQSAMVMDTNDFWASGSTASFSWANAAHTNDLQVDPQLTAAGSGGVIGNADQLGTLSAYKLGATSPLINAGLDLTTLGVNPGSFDFYGGASKSGVAYDVGAHEYVATSSPDKTPPSVSMIARNSAGQNISAGTSVSGTITFTVTASDPVVSGQITSGVSSIVLKLDGATVATSASGSLTYNLSTQNLLDAPHSVQAVAMDVAGNSASSQTFTLGAIGFMAGWQ